MGEEAWGVFLPPTPCWDGVRVTGVHVRVRVCVCVCVGERAVWAPGGCTDVLKRACKDA